MPAHVTGVHGAIKHAYVIAARLEGFTVSHRAGEWTLLGTVVARNEFALSQTPLIFEVPTQSGLMVWRVLSHTFTNDTVRARLGPPME